MRSFSALRPCTSLMTSMRRRSLPGSNSGENLTDTRARPPPKAAATQSATPWQLARSEVAPPLAWLGKSRLPKSGKQKAMSKLRIFPCVLTTPKYALIAPLPHHKARIPTTSISLHFHLTMFNSKPHLALAALALGATLLGGCGSNQGSDSGTSSNSGTGTGSGADTSMGTDSSAAGGGMSGGTDASSTAGSGGDAGTGSTAGSGGGAGTGSTAGGSTAGGSTAGGSTAGGSTAGGSTAGGSTAGGSTGGQ